MRPFAIAALTSALLALALPAAAEQLKFKADLSARDEVPPHADLTGTGHVEATVDSGSLKMTYDVQYADLTGTAQAAHFHGPAEAGKNAGVQVPVAGKVMSPMQATATITPEQLKMLEGGQMYFNIHTAKNPAGEIRGQFQKAM